jgi:hypothetical protein
LSIFIPSLLKIWGYLLFTGQLYSVEQSQDMSTYQLPDAEIVRFIRRITAFRQDFNEKQNAAQKQNI